MIERERDWAPVPHVLVHAVQELKALLRQWIGHGPCEQKRVSV